MLKYDAIKIIFHKIYLFQFLIFDLLNVLELNFKFGSGQHY
jgi:hypothetical protein